MRRAVLAGLVTLTSLVLLAPPALAAEHGTSCGTWSHSVPNGTGNLQGCVAANTGALGIEGLFRFQLTGATTGTWRVDFDYVRLFRNTVEIDSSEADRTLTPSGAWQQIDTGWNLGSCRPANYYVQARYRFRHLHDAVTHTSGWVVRQSGTYTATICV